MSFRVRSPDGELSYSAWSEIDRAWREGLIDPNDEILEESLGIWRRAGAHPRLRGSRPPGDAIRATTWRLVMIEVLLGGITLYFVFKARWVQVVVFAIIFSAFTSFLAYKANSLKKR